jgi:hypothetical protein
MVREIPLTQGKVALIDDEDFARVNAFKWYTLALRKTDGSCRYYAWRSVRQPDGKRVWIYLHRFLMNAPADLVVDHVNGNGLDCTRTNMRLATHAQNVQNMRPHKHGVSGFKGIWRRKSGRWQAEIRAEDRRIRLGTYDDPAFAAAIYDAAARQLFGHFSNTNFDRPNSEAEAIVAAQLAERQSA